VTFPVYFDENARPEVAFHLRCDGYDVQTASEAGLANAAIPDEVHLEHAARTGRILFSHDLKTMSGAAQGRLNQGNHHPGLILCDERSPGELIARLRLALQLYEPQDLRDATIWLPPLPA